MRFLTYTAGSHQGAINKFWLHFWRTVMSFIFINSLFPGSFTFTSLRPPFRPDQLLLGAFCSFQRLVLDLFPSFAPQKLLRSLCNVLTVTLLFLLLLSDVCLQLGTREQRLAAGHLLHWGMHIGSAAECGPQTKLWTSREQMSGETAWWKVLRSGLSALILRGAVFPINCSWTQTEKIGLCKSAQ